MSKKIQTILDEMTYRRGEENCPFCKRYHKSEHAKLEAALRLAIGAFEILATPKALNEDPWLHEVRDAALEQIEQVLNGKVAE